MFRLICPLPDGASLQRGLFATDALVVSPASSMGAVSSAIATLGSNKILMARNAVAFGVCALAMRRLKRAIAWARPKSSEIKPRAGASPPQAVEGRRSLKDYATAIVLSIAIGSVFHPQFAQAQTVCTGGPPNYICTGASSSTQTLNASTQAVTATVAGTFQVTGGGVTNTGGNGVTFTGAAGTDTILSGVLNLRATGSNNVNISIDRGTLTGGVQTTTTATGATTLNLGSLVSVGSNAGSSSVLVNGVGALTNAGAITGGIKVNIPGSNATSLNIINDGSISGSVAGIYVWNALNASTAISITNNNSINSSGGQGIGICNDSTCNADNPFNSTTATILNNRGATISSRLSGVYSSDSTGSRTATNLGTIASSASVGSFFEVSNPTHASNGGNIAWTNGDSSPLGANARVSGQNGGLRMQILNTNSSNGFINITNFGKTDGMNNGGIYGLNNYGVYAQNQSTTLSSAIENITINNFGSISAAGTGKSGVIAESVFGSVRIGNYSNNSITATGIGIDASALGNVTIINGDLAGPNPDGKITAGYQGIWARSTATGDVSVTNGANASITAGSAGVHDGIEAATNGTGRVTIQSAGTITATGNGVNVTAAVGNGGLASVISSTNAINAGLSGIKSTVTTGGASITNSGPITATAGDGVQANSTTGVIDIANSGAITANATGAMQRGIAAQASGAGNVTIASTGSSIASFNEGILATSLGGNVGVSNSATITNNAASGSSGIKATTNGSGTVGVTNAGAITASLNGVETSAADGATTIDNGGAITTTSGSGLSATATGAGAIGVINQAAINAGLNGITTSATTGATTIANSGPITATNGAGVAAAASGAGNVTIASTGSSIASFNEGILATSLGGNVGVTNSATITNNATSGSSGIKATTNAAGAVGVINSGAITASLNGVETSAADGATTLVNSGAITTTSGSGLSATATGAGAIGVINQATINAGLNGITTSATTGATTIANSGAILSQTASAIRVQNTGSAAITILNDTGGTLRGAGASTATAVISVSNAGTSPTTITNLGDIRSNSGAPGDLANYAIASTSPAFGAMTISNGDTIRGRISLTDAADSFSNLAGATWETTGLNSFGNGANTFNNAASAQVQSWGTTTFDMGSGAGNVVNNGGLIQLRNGADGTPATTNFTAAVPSDLLFNNSGLIDLSRDGSNLVSNRVNIQGNFVSSGDSQIAVNSQLGGVGSVSDRVFIDGNSSGAGTGIIVRDTVGGLGAANPIGIAVVGVKGANSPTDFTLNSASDHYKIRNGQPVLDKGLYFYFMAQTPTSVGCDNGYTCYSLLNAPSTAARSLPIAVTAAQTIWQEDALMWEDRQVELRDEMLMRTDQAATGQSVACAETTSRRNNAGGVGVNPRQDARAACAGDAQRRYRDGGVSTWVKSVGSWTNRSNAITDWGVGGRALSYDLGYRQNVFSMLGGADFIKKGVFSSEDFLIAGVMGGYLQSNVNFNQEAGNLLGPTRFTYQGGTLGGSLTYMSHGFFVDGLLKTDLLSSNLYIPVSGLTNTTAGVRTAGGVGNLGYRYDWGQYFIEPIATFTYSATNLGGIASAANNLAMHFGGGNDFRGGFGGRLGFVTPGLHSNHLVEASLTGRYWTIFEANAGRTIDILSGGVSDTIGDYTFGRDYGEVKGNLNIHSVGSGWSAFVNTGVRWNAQWTTVTTKGGGAYRW